MPDPAEEFAEAAPGVRTADPIRQRGLIHQYHAEVDATDGLVRIFTLAPDVTAEAVHTAFRKTADQWYNTSSHPNVVTVYDRGTEPHPWIAVELVDGQRLASLARQLSIYEIRTILMDVAKALRNAALYNTKHLGLNPQTVWVQDTDETVEAVVDDWGLERACHVAAGDPPETPYTPPEFTADPTAESEQADVYGLGALTYYALTGQPPSGPAIQAGTDSLPPPSTLAEDELDSAVDDVVLQALAREPAKRYESAYQYKRALARVLPSSRTVTADADDEAHEDEHEKTSAGEDDEETAESSRPTDTRASSTNEGETRETTADSTEDNEDATQEANDQSLVTTRRTALAVLGIGAVGIGGRWLAGSNGDGVTDNEGRDRDTDHEGQDREISDGTGSGETVSIVVGSKPYTEQINLGYVAYELIENNTDANPIDETSWGGNTAHADGYQDGEIHAYYDYMGSLWSGHPPENDSTPFDSPDEQYDALKEEMEEEHPIQILDRADWQNTWTLFVPEENLEETDADIETISDLANYVNDGNYDIEIVYEDGFRYRSDGFDALIDHYGFEDEHVENWEEAQPDGEFLEVSDGASTGEAVGRGDGDAGFGYRTSAWLDDLDDVVLLEDDEAFWPFFHPVGIVHEDVATDEVVEALNMMPDAIPDVQTMQELNAQAADERPQQVVRNYLSSEGFI